MASGGIFRGWEFVFLFTVTKLPWAGIGSSASFIAVRPTPAVTP